MAVILLFADSGGCSGGGANSSVWEVLRWRTQASWHKVKTGYAQEFEKVGHNGVAACNRYPSGTVLRLRRVGGHLVLKVLVVGTGPFAVRRNGCLVRPLRPHPARGLDLGRETMRKLGGLKAGVVTVNVIAVRRKAKREKK